MSFWNQRVLRPHRPVRRLAQLADKSAQEPSVTILACDRLATVKAGEGALIIWQIKVGSLIKVMVYYVTMTLLGTRVRQAGVSSLVQGLSISSWTAKWATVQNWNRKFVWGADDGSGRRGQWDSSEGQTWLKTSVTTAIPPPQVYSNSTTPQRPKTFLLPSQQKNGHWAIHYSLWHMTNRWQTQSAFWYHYRPSSWKRSGRYQQLACRSFRTQDGFNRLNKKVVHHVLPPLPDSEWQFGKWTVPNYSEVHQTST